MCCITPPAEQRYKVKGNGYPHPTCTAQPYLRQPWFFHALLKAKSFIRIYIRFLRKLLNTIEWDIRASRGRLIHSALEPCTIQYGRIHAGVVGHYVLRASRPVKLVYMCRSLLGLRYQCIRVRGRFEALDTRMRLFGTVIVLFWASGLVNLLCLCTSALSRPLVPVFCHIYCPIAPSAAVDLLCEYMIAFQSKRSKDLEWVATHQRISIIFELLCFFCSWCYCWMFWLDETCKRNF